MSIPDTHCHLTDRAYDPDRAEVLGRARKAGIGEFITVGTDPDDWQKCLDLARSETDVYLAAAIHPHEAAAHVARPGQQESPALAWLREVARSPKFVAIGETGLDYHYMNSPKEAQIEMFRAQLDVARELSRREPRGAPAPRRRPLCRRSRLPGMRPGDPRRSNSR